MADLFSREKIDEILAIIPPDARCCYTGQSILAYCPNPTFSWAELNTWPDVTDVDIFCYSKPCLASVIQAFVLDGWTPEDPIAEFKVERICFWETPAKNKNMIQTVGLTKLGLPTVNLTWYHESTSLVTTIARFDQDYLMVGMDCRTKRFLDMRGENHRVAHVNVYNSKFDSDDVDVMFWVRQFDRCPKGWSRGIDTRPVAKQYIEWLDATIARGDWASCSKTRQYAEKKMNNTIALLVESGQFSEEQAKLMYHLFRHEDNTPEALRMNLTEIRVQISEWLASVEDD